MVSSMLQAMYLQEGFYYEELFRRFCQKDSQDPEVKEFQSECSRQGVPSDLLTPNKWRIMPERVLGGGDRTLAQVQAQWLLDHKTAIRSAAQQRILRLATSTMLKIRPSEFVCPARPGAGHRRHARAEGVFGTLMQGVDVSLREGIDQIGYIEAMLKMMGGIVKRIEATDNMVK